jgi:hypothetical protein
LGGFLILRKTLLIPCLLLAAGAAGAEDFQAIFGLRYDDALGYVESRASEWISRCKEYGVDPKTLIPVVFPELIRYSIFRDEIESAGVAAFYVPFGVKYADFSIGYFQMKPSFIEKLEDSLTRMEGLPPPIREILEFPPAADERDRRGIRFAHLLDVEWLLRYLAGFALVMEARFHPGLMEQEERIRFLAAAYNRGFWLSREEIQSAEAWRLFPNGVSPAGTGPYCYTDVAVDFFRRYWQRICEDTGLISSR